MDIEQALQKITEIDNQMTEGYKQFIYSYLDHHVENEYLTEDNRNSLLQHVDAIANIMMDYFSYNPDIDLETELDHLDTVIEGFLNKE